MKTVAVFFGGRSVEHDVSVITGVLTLNSIDKTVYQTFPVYVDKSGRWYTGKALYDIDGYKDLDINKLTEVAMFGGSNSLYAVKWKMLKKLAEISVAVNCMHGERGEDGTLSGMLNALNIPLASPPVLSSAVCMDKTFTKTVLKGLKIKCLPSVSVKSVEEWNLIKDKPPLPLIIKPSKLGSSIGIKVAKSENEVEDAISYALRFGDTALIEPCLIDFKEINCAAYLRPDGSVRVSECERPVGRTQILSFCDKYEGGKRVFPADISKKSADKIKKLTEKIYLALGVRGVIRIDYFLVEGEVFVNEINTVPGSLAYYLFGETLKSFTAMLTELITVAERDFAKERTFITEYKSGILFGYGSKGAKRL